MKCQLSGNDRLQLVGVIRHDIVVVLDPALLIYRSLPREPAASAIGPTQQVQDHVFEQMDNRRAPLDLLPEGVLRLTGTAHMGIHVVRLWEYPRERSLQLRRQIRYLARPQTLVAFQVEHENHSSGVFDAIGLRPLVVALLEYHSQNLQYTVLLGGAGLPPRL